VPTIVKPEDSTTVTKLKTLSDYIEEDKPELEEEIKRYDMEILCGDSSIYTLNKVKIDYLKVPETIKLTREQINDIGDKS